MFTKGISSKSELSFKTYLIALRVEAQNSCTSACAMITTQPQPRTGLARCFPPFSHFSCLPLSQPLELHPITSLPDQAEQTQV